MKIYVSRRALHKVRNLCFGVGVDIKKELPANPQELDAALAGKPAPVGWGGKEFFLIEVGEGAEEKLLPLLSTNIDSSDFVIVLDLAPPRTTPITLEETQSAPQEEIVTDENTADEVAQKHVELPSTPTEEGVSFVEQEGVSSDGGATSGREGATSRRRRRSVS